MSDRLEPLSVVSDSPPRRAEDGLGRVLSNDWVNARYKHLVLAAGATATAAAPGQFFHLQCPSTEADQPFFRRPMSCYGAFPEKGTIEFLYKVVGAGTRGLAELLPGDDLPILGPLGQGFRIDPRWKSLVVLGRGVGLATLAPLAEAAVAGGCSVTAIFSARDSVNVMSVQRFATTGATTCVVLDSDGSSDPDNVETILRDLHADGHADAFFTCGSTRLMLLMQRLGRELGVPGQVAMEQQMACGLGMCFCCVRDFKVGGEIVNKRVCWDGPVFDLAEVLP